MTITPLWAAPPAGADLAEPQQNRPRTAHVRVQMNVYEATGEALTTLKPMDLEALEALVAETRKKRNEGRSRTGGKVNPTVTEKLPVNGFFGALQEGAYLVSSPTFTMPASNGVDAKPSQVNVGQMLRIPNGGFSANMVQPLGLSHLDQANNEAQELQEVSVGLTVDARAWLDVRNKKILLETQLRLSSFEGFTQVDLTEFDQGSQFVIIPLLKTIVNEKVSQLEGGETRILAWQENVTETLDGVQRTLIVVTVTPTLIQSSK